jgi:hypothetical protein
MIVNTESLETNVELLAKFHRQLGHVLGPGYAIEKQALWERHRQALGGGIAEWLKENPPADVR